MTPETQEVLSTNEARKDIKAVGKTVLDLKEMLASAPKTGDGKLDGEVMANVTLAFRHLEDAAMRLGKVLQALNGGESQYDNSGVVGQK